MDDQSPDIAQDDQFIPLAPAEQSVDKTCPVCFAKMVPDSPVCHRCHYDERVGPESSVHYKRVTADNRYGDTTAPQRVCRHCDYDLSGLPAITTCPECGNSIGSTSALHAARRASEDHEREAYRSFILPGILFAIGLGSMLLIYALTTNPITLTNNTDLIPVYLVKYAARAPLVLIVFFLCSIIWIGFDEPIHLTAIRITAILPFVDLVGLIGYGVVSSMIPPVILDMIFIHRWIQVVTLGLLLHKVADVDLEDVAILSIAIIFVYTLFSVYFNMAALGPGGMPWPQLY